MIQQVVDVYVLFLHHFASEILKNTTATAEVFGALHSPKAKCLVLALATSPCGAADMEVEGR